MMESGEYTIFNFETYNNSPEYVIQQSVLAKCADDFPLPKALFSPSRPWHEESDTKERNEMARKAFRSIFTFTPYDEANFASVGKQQQRGSIYLDGLYDGMLLYAAAINKALNESNGKTPKGYDIVRNMMGTTFEGRFLVVG